MAPVALAALPSCIDREVESADPELDAPELNANVERIENLYLTRTRRKILSKEEEVELAIQLYSEDATSRERAREIFVEANQGLVVKNVRKHITRIPLGSAMTFMDLVQEANIGLLYAIERFDYTRGYKFSTYATWWIMQAIQRSIHEQSRLIRYPEHLQTKLHRLFDAQVRLTELLGREPTQEELAEETHLSLAQLETFSALPTVSYSLDRRCSDDSDQVLADLLADPGPGPEEEAVQEIREQHVSDAIRTLVTAREMGVLELRFGLGEGRSHTLEEIGEKFHVTRERIRQIEKRAMSKLRRSSHLHNLYASHAD